MTQQFGDPYPSVETVERIREVLARAVQLGQEGSLTDELQDDLVAELEQLQNRMVN